MANIFISYSSEDKTLVKQLAELLEKKGWSVWWDRQIPIGQTYDSVIEHELNQASCVLVVWTRRSVNSEWVKNEANEALNQKKLVPILLEKVDLPLAFRRTETAQLTDWNGISAHSELDLLYDAINNKLNKQLENGSDDSQSENTKTHHDKNKDQSHIKDGMLPSRKTLIITMGVLLSLALLIYFWNVIKTRDEGKQDAITIRVFDLKKNPITNGDVKIHLKEYIREQSIDKMGQALFTGIPPEILIHPLKIVISSPGYATKTYDTFITNSKPLEFTLPLNEVIMISGRIKTAAEIPIKDVEVGVDGTRYATTSITDGSYNLRLEEYTLGDEITITTSHPKYEDKTLALKITSPELKNQDIFLNPVQQ